MLPPVLDNLYLNPLDHQMAAVGFEMVRYADDFVILCRSQTESEEALSMVRQSLTRIITEIKRAARGWFYYFRYCYWPVFKAFDGMIR